MKAAYFVILCAAVVLSQPLRSFGYSEAAVTVLRIKIEAPELDKAILLAKLQERAADNKLKFESVEQDFNYRIVFATGQAPVMTQYGAINASLASADVYDSAGKELFKFDRKGRWTDKGATNAVANEIVKRLLKWRSLSR
jgi:hypothetical protein